MREGRWFLVYEDYINRSEEEIKVELQAEDETSAEDTARVVWERRKQSRDSYSVLKCILDPDLGSNHFPGNPRIVFEKPLMVSDN